MAFLSEATVELALLEQFRELGYGVERENATLVGAFNQLQTYKQQIPQLFHTNALLVTSDGAEAIGHAFPSRYPA